MRTRTARRRPTAAAICAVVTALMAGALSAATTNASPSASPSASTSGREGAELMANQRVGLQLELIDQDFTIASGGTLRLVYRLTGDLERIAELSPTDEERPRTTTTTTTNPETLPDTTPLPTPVELTVEVANYEPVTGEDANSAYLDKILGQNAQPSAFRNNIDGVGNVDVRPRVVVDTDDSATLTIEIPTDVGTNPDRRGPDSLEFPEPGVYPIRLQFLVAGDLAATHGTLVERRIGPDDVKRDSSMINLAVIAHVDRQDGVTGLSQQALDAANRAIDLAASIETPLLASLPPNVLASVIEERSAATVALALANDELSAITDIDLDVSSAVAAGQSEAFSRHLRAGEDLLTELLPTTLSRRGVWIATEPLSGAGAQELRDLGFRYVVMTPELYATTIDADLPENDRFVEVTLPDGGTYPVIVVDELSAQLTPEATDEILETATPTEWAVRTLAILVLDHRQNGRAVQRSRVLSTPDLGVPDPRLIAELERLAPTTTDVQFIAASALTGVTATQGAPGDGILLLPESAGPDLIDRIARIEDTRAQLASAGSMLSSDDERPQRWTDSLDTLVSTGISNADADAIVDGLLAEVQALRDAVVPPDPFTFTMTGRSDSITLRFSNTGDVPLNVVVQLTSSKLTFPNNDRALFLRPNASTDIQIPVRARANGTSAVNVTVLTPLGDPLGDSVTLTSRVNALTGLGQVLTGGFILMLLAWWFNNWIAKRRASDNDETNDNEHVGVGGGTEHDEAGGTGSEAK